MAYNTKPIVTDKDGNPISQYYNKELDQYEPVEGSGGGNKVVLYNADGTENNELSLISILDKLSQLTGTVIDEETRKSNELLRIAFYEQLQQMLADGDLKGDKGDIGIGLEFDWQGNSLGVRLQGEVDYIYVDLKGDKGDKGETGNIDNLNAQHIEDALGYVPADEDIVGMLANLTTEEKANLVSAINEVKTQSNENASHVLENVNQKSVHGLRIEEGVFEPFLVGSSVAGVNSYSRKAGTYYKIDNRVFCDIRITLSEKDVAMNGTIYISGLPFTPRADVQFSGSVSLVSEFVFPENIIALGINIPHSQGIRFMAPLKTGSFTIFNQDNFKDNTDLILSINYSI